MSHTINVLFYSKASRATKESLIPIYFRITVNGIRIYDKTTHKVVESGKWCSQTKRVKGNGEAARTINKYLDALKAKVDNLETQMVKEGEDITPDTFAEKWSGETEKPKTIMSAFAEHNLQMKKLVEKEKVAPGTLERYNTSFDHTANFMKWKYNVEDMAVKKLNYEFVSQYDFG